MEFLAECILLIILPALFALFFHIDLFKNEVYMVRRERRNSSPRVIVYTLVDSIDLIAHFPLPCISFVDYFSSKFN